jgi:hypothetical protein
MSYLPKENLITKMIFIDMKGYKLIYVIKLRVKEEKVKSDNILITLFNDEMSLQFFSTYLTSLNQKICYLKW